MKVLLHTLANIASMVVIFLPLISGPGMDFQETENLILNLVEGSVLNYSTEVELSPLQSMYACVTKNLTTTFDDLDLNAPLSIGACVECDINDIGQKCAHQFNSSLTKITINQFQNDIIQLMNFFKDSVSLSDNRTKIICAYATGNEVVPFSTIDLNVSHCPNNHYTLLVTVIVSCFILVVFTCILCACILCIICCRSKQCELIQ